MSKSRSVPGFHLIRLAAVLSAVLAVSACKMGTDAQAKEADKKGPDAIPVEVAKVERRGIAASYSNTATLEPVAESQVVAKTSGVALQVMVEEGQQVRAGQVLVRLTPTAPACRPPRARHSCRSWRPTSVARSSLNRSRWSAPTTSTSCASTWKTPAR